MARKLRLEFPGACYHVINRGNYRMHVFQSDGAKTAFEECLFEACEKSRWLLHAFVVMSNHYHLALETPEGNLVAGMQWLQATFANRFNRLRNERGHLFQGRYKSLLVEEGGPLGQLCHYLHLNPTRAGIVPAERLGDYRYSSYWYLWEKKRRPASLCCSTALEQAGGLVDHRRGWEAYANYLVWQAAEGPAGRNKAYVTMSRGWALGSRDFKAALIKDHDLAAATRAWETVGANEIKEAQWAEALAGALRALKKTKEEALKERKSSPWKIAVAAHLKRISQATNQWLTEQLHMGSPVAVSQYVGAMRHGAHAEAAVILKKLAEKLKA